MRINGGRHRGRKLAAPEGRDTRPTSDRTREAVFNVLLHGIEGLDLEGAAVADLFAGTGALGLEALSRGAVRAVFVDASQPALLAARRNAAALGEVKNIVTLRLDCTRLPPPPGAAGAPLDLAFLDPPYESGLAHPALQGLAAKGWLKDGAICVVEVAAREPFAPPKGFDALQERVYGRARVIFLRFIPTGQ
ncbi:MAG: 16S rRNA (guanine(966)-N(2))-methyltransferase RsmD [Magnetospirillum sp. WYHS-4]